MAVFKKTIIVFWFLWWAAALWTDIVGGLHHLGILQASWAPDNNFPFLVKTLSIYPLPGWFPALFYVGIIGWMLIITLLFLHASLSLAKPKKHWLPLAERAFIASLWLWMAFFLADQMVMQYELEENHMVQAGFQLLSFLCLYLLPEKNKQNVVEYKS